MAQPTPDPSTAPASPLTGWTAVRLYGRKYLIGAAEATIERLAAPAGGERSQIHVTAGIFGATHRDQWILSERGVTPHVVLRFLEYVLGKSPELVTARQEGCVLDQRFDVPKERLPSTAAGWPLKRTKTLPATRDAAAAIDPYAVLLRGTQLMAEPRTRLTFLTRDGYGDVLVERQGRERLALWLKDDDAGRTASVTLTAVRVRLTSATDPAHGETAFGMEGAATLWFDVATGAPVQLEGPLKDNGTVRLQLAGVSRRPRPSPVVAWPDPPACPEHASATPGLTAPAIRP